MKHSWLLRPCPGNINRIEEFRKGDFVAIGWAALGDLQNCSREKIKQLLAAPPYSLSGHSLGTSYGTVDIFVNRMQVGDLLLIPDGADIYFAEITGDYHRHPALAALDYAHQRAVKWLQSADRSALSKPLRDSLKAQNTAADFSKHSDEIAALAAGKPYISAADQADTIAVSYPLRKDFSVEFSIPADITKAEARRLAQYLETLYFSE